MQKCNYVVEDTDRNHHNKLDSLEGVVNFSEGGIAPGDFPNLRLNFLGDIKNEFWLRVDHIIEVGTNLRVHYKGYGRSPRVIRAYEIVASNGDISYRYHEQFCKFID